MRGMRDGGGENDSIKERFEWVELVKFVKSGGKLIKNHLAVK